MRPTHHPVIGLLRSSLLTKSLGIIGGLGLLSSGLAWSQTDVLVDNIGSPAPTAPAPAAAPPQLNKGPKPTVATSPAPAPAPQPAAAPAPKPAPAPLPAPTVAVPPRTTPTPSNIPAQLQDRPPVAAQTPTRQTETYIDRTQYNTPSTAASPAAAPRVVVRDRTQACTTTVQNGRLSQGNCGTARQPSTAPLARQRPPAPPNVRIPSALNQPPRPLARRGVPPLNSRKNQHKSGSGLRRVVPQTFNLPTLINRTLKRPAPYPNNGNRGLLFPLGLPSDISSAFGWRVHPIQGGWRMHTGTDFAAPQGTPVLATYHGEVALAEAVGGYGNMVVLRHEEGDQESRYAHLSHIFVQPGEWVEQGEVIGLVGSTGNSTGPHLHFEWRHWLANEWVAVDAGPQLKWALAEMRQAMLNTLPPEEREQLELGQVALGSGTLLLDPEASVPVAQSIHGFEEHPIETVEVVEPQVGETKEMDALQVAPKTQPQALYRLEQSAPDQPLQVKPSLNLLNPAIQP